MEDYDIRICLGRCGWDASHQPPEVKRCLTCNSPLGTIPLSMIQEWKTMTIEEPEEDD